MPNSNFPYFFPVFFPAQVRIYIYLHNWKHTIQDGAKVGL